MDVVIRGKNVKVSESLRTAATEHLTKLDRYANGFARAEVDFSEERNPRIADNQKCEVLVHVKGHLLKAHASAPEPFAALYAVCDKVEHQVKRLKDKRVARSHPKRVRTQRVELPAQPLVHHGWRFHEMGGQKLLAPGERRCRYVAQQR